MIELVYYKEKSKQREEKMFTSIDNPNMKMCCFPNRTWFRFSIKYRRRESKTTSVHHQTSTAEGSTEIQVSAL